MADHSLATQIGNRVTLTGHFDVPVVLEDVRPLGANGSAGYECRVRLPDGALEEAVISPDEALAILGTEEKAAARPADAERVRLLIESARIRLAYAYDRQFAVSLSGIRTLPHQIEAVFLRVDYGDAMLVEVVVHGMCHRIHDQIIGLPFDNQPALREKEQR